MAKQLVIDWERGSLILAQAGGRGSSVALTSFDHQQYSNVVEDQLPGTAAEALKSLADRAAVGKSDVTVVASRGMVEMRTISVPRIEADELPDVIRFQAQRQLANMGDNWTLDYVMLPDSGQEMQTALVGALSPENKSAIESACGKSNLQVAHIALRPIEIARYAAAFASGANATLVVCASDEYVDLMVTRNQHLVLVRSTRLPSESESQTQAMVGEIRRTLLAASSSLGGAEIEEALLLASGDLINAHQSAIAEAVGGPCTTVDLSETLPADMSGRQELAQRFGNRLAAICGASRLGSAEKQDVVDFQDPKKRPPPKKNTFTYALAAAAALLVVGGGISWWVKTNRDLDSELELLTESNAGKLELEKQADAQIKKLGEVGEFANSSPQFLDELVYLAKNMPDSDKVRVIGMLTMNTLQTGEGQITIDLAADSDDSIRAFEESLRDEDYRVDSQAPRESTQPTPLYKWEAREIITISNRGWDLIDQLNAAKVSSSDEALSETNADTADSVEPAEESTDGVESPETDGQPDDETNDQPTGEEQPETDSASQVADVAAIDQR